jgi:hypothetical protein
MPKLNNENPKRKVILIEVPVGDVPPATWGLHINTHLTPDQSTALRRVTAALDGRLARLSSGRRIISNCDALKYMLEQLVDP